jgi:DNA-binding CsgD family transcriptional regulator/ligand-binding sensor protein
LKINELLQDVQDAYASLIDLPIIIIDSENTSVTSVSNMNKLAKFIMFTDYKWIQKEWDSYFQLKNPAIIESNFQGLKLIAAPIIVNDQVECFIFAGPFIEKGKKRLVKEQCESNSVEWIQAIEEASEISMIDIQHKLSHVEKMSNVCAHLIAAEKQKGNRLYHFKLLQQAMDDIHFHSLLRIEHFLSAFQQLDKHIDFVIYAKRKNEKSFVVDHVISSVNGQEWIDETYECDRPLIKRILNEKKPLYLENLSLRLEMAEFINKDIKPKALLLYPVIHNDKIIGIIFVGSQEKKQLTPEVKETGYLLTKLIEISFKQQLSELLIDKHLMRVSTLIEISKAMSMVDNVDEILRIMNDVAIDLVQGNFSTIILNNYESKIITNSKFVGDSKFNDYCNDVRARYFDDNQESFPSSPILLETNLGTVMEYPFYVEQHLQGVLAAHITNPDAIKEAEVYLLALITITTVILQQVIHNKERFLPNPPINTKLLSDSLTSREMDVLRYLVQGYSNREIAEKLFISVHTVKNHVTNIFQKLGVTDRSQVIAMAYQLNYARVEWK